MSATNGRGTRSKGGVDATTGNGAAASAGATDGIPQSTRSYRLTDSTLRDGSHALRHQYTPEQAAAIAGALDRVGVPVIEISHGDGLGGSSFNYGFSRIDERELIRAAAAVVTRAKLAILLVPGIGLASDLEVVRELGVSVARIATHCTEADVAIQHLRTARDLGIETVGFLMMAHSVGPEVLAKQARIMADAGCQCVYVVDSAGAMVMEDASDRVAAVVAELGSDAQVGFHGHENLSLSVANTVLAIRAGAVQADGSTRRFGAGAGNTSVEALAAVLERLGVKTGIDVLKIIDAAEDVVRPVMDEECVLDRLALIMGYAGVYSSFLKHAYRAAERYGVSGAEILLECGRQRLVGGQEDQIIQIAAELAKVPASATA